MDLTRSYTPEEFAAARAAASAPPVPLPVPTCCKCGGQMEAGFIVDHAYGSNDVSVWVPGEPEFGLMGNLKLPTPQYRIRTFACVECGYLESYIERQKV